jgi:hypothetical protein
VASSVKHAGTCRQLLLPLQVVTIFGIPYTDEYYKKWGSILTIIFSALPWCPFAKAMQDLGAATAPGAGNKGISWADRDSYCEARRRDPVASAI